MDAFDISGMSNAEAEKLVVRMCKCLGLKLVYSPKSKHHCEYWHIVTDAKLPCDEHGAWIGYMHEASDVKAFIAAFFASRYITIIDSTRINSGGAWQTTLLNTFYRLSIDEVYIKLDLVEAGSI